MIEESRQERRDNFLLQGQLSVLTLISVSVPPPCYRSSTWKITVGLRKVQVAGAGGRLQLKTHTPYLCGFKWSDTVTWCMVEWWTQNLRRSGSISRGTSHATTTERYQYTTSVDINNTRYKRIQSLIQNHKPMQCAQWVCSRAENSAIYKSHE